jgi:periplasmic copper chaperone A
MTYLRSVYAALVLFAVADLAWAQDYAAGSLEISQVWTREAPPASKVAGGFMTITNTGREPDTLLGGSLVGAGKLEVHDMTIVGGIMKMRELKPGLVIKPGESVVLKPGSYHLMFLDLAASPKAGQPIKGPLVFEKAGKVEIEYKVEPFGTRVPGDGGQQLPKAGSQKKGGSGHGHH